MKHSGGSIMLWGCFAAGGTGALHKTDGIMRQEKYVAILKHNLNISEYQKLKLGHKCVFQMDNDPKHTSKVVVTWLNLGQTFRVAFHKIPTISWVMFGPFLLTELV
jgi:hypothetical protein